MKGLGLPRLSVHPLAQIRAQARSANLARAILQCLQQLFLPAAQRCAAARQAQQSRQPLQNGLVQQLNPLRVLPVVHDQAK